MSFESLADHPLTLLQNTEWVIIAATDHVLLGATGTAPLAIIRGPNRAALATALCALPDIITALRMAEAFVAGFEGDETQEGIDVLLEAIRIAIAKSGAVP
jgi:hypothetical protein